MSYREILDDVFMALVDVGRSELADSGEGALQHYKDCREVRDNNRGALILAYKKNDFSLLNALGLIGEEPEILDGTYNREKLASFIREHKEDDYALLINPLGAVGVVEEINNNPSGISDSQTYGLMPDEILCLNKRTKAGSRTKAAARAAAGNEDIHTFVKKQSGPNPKMVIEFDEYGAHRQAYAGNGSGGDIAFYVQEFEPADKGWNASTPELMDNQYAPKKVASDVPVGQNPEITAAYGIGVVSPQITLQMPSLNILHTLPGELFAKQ
jgi:hypothetical protein